MASTFAKKHTNYLVSYFWFPFIVFFLFYVIIVIFLSFLSFWVEPYVFPLLRKHFTYKTYQCKFCLIVPEEGWFGQPKYSTPSKISLACRAGVFLRTLVENRVRPPLILVPSPCSIFNPSSSPLESFFGSPQTSVSFIIQNGGRAFEG